MPYLIVDAFDLVEQALGAQCLGVILLEVHSLVVQGLEVCLLILLTPDLIEALLGLPPLFLLGLQPVGRGAQCLMPRPSCDPRRRVQLPHSKYTFGLYGTEQASMREAKAEGCPVLAGLGYSEKAPSKKNNRRAWWYKSIIPALEDLDSEGSLGTS